MPVIYFTEEQLQAVKESLRCWYGAGYSDDDKLAEETLNTINNQIKMVQVNKDTS